MFPYSWSVIFSVSILSFFLINSSWSKFFLSPLMMKKESQHSMKTKNFWKHDL